LARPGARQADWVGADGASQLRKDRTKVSVGFGLEKPQRLNRIDSGREHPDVANCVGADCKQQSEVIAGRSFRRRCDHSKPDPLRKQPREVGRNGATRRGHWIFAGAQQ
jgi:hypothetical protein